MGFSCISGANEALLYDRLNNEDLYGQVLGKSYLFSLVGTTLAGILGPYLFSQYFRFPYLFSTIPFFLAGLIILFFYESEVKGKFTIRHHLRQMRDASKVTYGNRFIRWAGFVLALVFAVSYTMSNAFQPYLQNIGFNVKTFSIILPAMFLFQGLGGFVSRKFYNYLGENKLFVLSLLLLALSIGLMGIFAVKITVLALFAYTFIQGVAAPLVSTYSNRYIASHQRATVLSVQSMGSTVAAALPLFLFGFLTDKFGLNKLLITLGIIILLASITLISTKPKEATT
jgi:MFS family permease